jgi:hypothetical protein
MSAKGPQNNQENDVLAPSPKPLMASPAGIHTTSPRSGNPKFIVGGTYDENGVPKAPRKKNKCSIV